MKLPKNMKLSAEWTDDCCGKKDYDGEIVSISTRYWPRGGSFLLLDTSRPENGFQGGDSRPEIKPSAASSLILRHGDGDYVDFFREEFDGETEEEVKAKVEAWAQEKMDWVISTLLRARSQEGGEA